MVDYKILQNNYKISKNYIFFKNIVNLSTIEIIVELNKIYNNKKFPLNKKDKWFFTMLELNKKLPIYENQTIKITLVQKILNKITKSKIEINKILYGYIFFSRVNSI